MSWFSKERPAPQRASAGPLGSGHRSLALRALLEALHPASRPAVLDLGPPLAGNLKFLSALSCRVRVADLHRSLCAEPVESRRPDAMPALLERLLPLEPSDRFDAVLAWDVFDYMRKDQVAALMARLTPQLQPTAHVMVLVSMRSQVPAVPVRYKIVDRDTLQLETVGREGSLDQARAGPRYRQADLATMMPGLRVRRCYLMRNGVQEYLLGVDAQLST